MVVIGAKQCKVYCMVDTPVFLHDVMMTETRSSSVSADRSTTCISSTLDVSVNVIPSVQHLLGPDPFSTSVPPVAVTSGQGAAARVQ